MTASPLDPEVLRAHVERVWDETILPTLHEYIRIPNKSPHFDPDWAEHGHMEAAVKLIRQKASVQSVAAAKLGQSIGSVAAAAEECRLALASDARASATDPETAYLQNQLQTVLDAIDQDNATIANGVSVSVSIPDVSTQTGLFI